MKRINNIKVGINIKDSMKKFELILGTLCFIGLIMNFLMLTGGGIISVLGICTLSSFYMYFSFAFFNNIPLKKIFKKESYHGISRKRISGTVLTGFCLSLATIRILFRFQSYPGAVFNLYVGTLGLTIAFIVGVLKYQKNHSSFYPNILKRIVAIGSLSLVFAILPKFMFMELKFRNYPVYIEALKEAANNPNRPELWDNVNTEREKIYNE